MHVDAGWVSTSAWPTSRGEEKGEVAVGGEIWPALLVKRERGSVGKESDASELLWMGNKV